MDDELKVKMNTMFAACDPISANTLTSANPETTIKGKKNQSIYIYIF